MGLQFRYQKAKLYRQVAMGEKHHMSISQGTISDYHLGSLLSQCLHVDEICVIFSSTLHLQLYSNLTFCWKLLCSKVN